MGGTAVTANMVHRVHVVRRGRRVNLDVRGGMDATVSRARVAQKASRVAMANTESLAREGRVGYKVSRGGTGKMVVPVRKGNLVGMEKTAAQVRVGRRDRAESKANQGATVEMDATRSLTVTPMCLPRTSSKRVRR